MKLLTRAILGEDTGHNLRFFGMGGGLSGEERDVRALACVFHSTVGGGGSGRLRVHVRSVG